MKNTFGLPRSEESIRAQPDFKFYPKSVQQHWLNFYQRNRFVNQVSYEKRARWIEIRNKLIKAIYDAGGKIMAGSDSPEFLFLYGFSQHRELKALREAGLSNYAALEAATKNPSMFFGTLDKVGTIEKGKRADLDFARRESFGKHFEHRKPCGRNAQRKILRTDGIEQMARRNRAAHCEFDD